MPSSAEAPQGSVADTIVALERSCLDAEAALVERNWTDLSAAFAAQASLTAHLRLLFDRDPGIAPAHDPKVAQRLHGILAYRDGQLQRLHAYRTAIRDRLHAIGKVRALARRVGTAARSGALYDVQR